MARVLFFQEALYESFGPQILSAVLRQDGHDCDMLILACDGKRSIVRALRKMRPDIVAFSISSFGYAWSLELAALAKSEVGAVTVFGGPHPTYATDFARRSEVDFACRGEGEGALLELVRALAQGGDVHNIRNLISKNDAGELKVNPLRPLIQDLDSVPFPDRSLHFKYPALRDLPYKRFAVGRGCPYGCTFCFNNAAKSMYAQLGRYVRHRSPENIVAEIQQVRSRYGIGIVGIVDDTFTVDKKWMLRFLELYRREVKLPFTCVVRANELDEEVTEALGSSGCRYASFGVEVGSERLRNTVLGRRMSDDQIRRAARLLHANGVKFLTYNMFGIPGETAADGMRTIALNVEIGADLFGTSIFQPLVGTELYELCRREGYLDDRYAVEDYEKLTTTSPLRKMPDLPFLERLQKIGFIAVHFPKLTPLIELLARLPLNPLYSLVFKVNLFLRFKVRFQLSLRDCVRIGFRARGRFG